MPRLGVNIDHIATLRQARRGAEPDPLRAAHEAELGGADIITIHLREDRRHIQDHDVERLAGFARIRLNLEMAATDEMVDIARRIGPGMCTLVPEGRLEITTEGGIDVIAQRETLASCNARLREMGIRVSAFIDPDPKQARACRDAGFQMIEVHTGPYAEAFDRCGGDFDLPELRDALDAVAQTGAAARELGLRFNAGHALNYHNVEPIAALPGVEELHIGHAIVARAVFTGFRNAVAEMKALIRHAAPRG
ncbi:MAG: pyridoxine 5'-phosphate synthase [Phycisphaerales bacterium]